MPTGLSFDDPMASSHMPWGDRGDSFFQTLDQAWAQGRLPQRFYSAPATSGRGRT